jgi:mycofactocin precursor
MTDATAPGRPTIAEPREPVCAADKQSPEESVNDTNLVLDDEMLTEDISIDGMCGVY